MSDEINTSPIECAKIRMSEDLWMFAGGAVLLLFFSGMSYFIPAFQDAAIANFGVLLGAAAMKMKGNA